MFDQTWGSLLPRIPSPFRRMALCLAALAALQVLPAAAQDNPSGLPLPRFATTRSEPTNVRVGPGEKYDIAWTFIRSGIPVEIVQEFDTWRKIRDVEGDEGWVHQNLLTGTRMGYVTPILAGGEIALRAGQSDDAGARARLGPGLKVAIKQCDGTWCEVSVTHDRSTYAGWLRQEELWGVYPNEAFD